MFSSKINSYVSFPLENLDMRPYLHKDCKDKITLYDLIAVICHHGTAGGGHYTTYALNYINLSWYEFDDQTVTEVDPQQVEGCEAYVLFYRKKNDDMQVLRQTAQELLQRSERSFMTFFISKQWINKFNTFAEPGPINNYDFLCRHGEIQPAATTVDIAELVMEIPQSLWEFLHARFGGGPAVNRLSVCQPCLMEEERLCRRQQQEKDAFLKLNTEFQERCTTGAVYALSMAWFREWENFVCAKRKEPPGPIDNSKISQVKNGVPVVIMHSDYVQVSEDMWLLLRDIYGGGPELVLKPASAQLQCVTGSSGRKVIEEASSAASKAGESVVI
jgi:ubiquitin carboxyl-terminal hydrolase 20/33